MSVRCTISSCQEFLSRLHMLLLQSESKLSKVLAGKPSLQPREDADLSGSTG